MKTKLLLLILVLLGSGCKREKEPNKVLDGLPAQAGEVVIPFNAIQQLIQLKSSTLGILIPAINRTGLPTPNFDDLTNLGGGVYEFVTTNPRFVVATNRIRFFDGTGAQIDPIATQTSTQTLKTATVIVTGGNDVFAFSETLNMVIETEGDPGTNKELIGTSQFTGSNNTINFTLPSNRAQQEGMTNGKITGTGTGPNNQPITIDLTVRSDRSVDGTLTWEGRTGQIHVNSDGSGYIISDNKRLIFN